MGQRWDHHRFNRRAANETGWACDERGRLNVLVHSLPIQILRTYDSIDKQKRDFGIGWSLEIANIKVQTNGPLGAGGWSAQPSGCMSILGQGICLSKSFKRLAPHFVTVRWPDGRQEVFDFTPQAGADLYYDASAAFTGRSGSTSKLEVDGDPYIQYLNDGNIYNGDLTSHFDPQRFRLTAKDGTTYVIDRDQGVISATDRHGNYLQVTRDGVISSTGKSITFTRDAQDRITKLWGPSGEVVQYAYGPTGDLTNVTDARANTMRFTYDAGHNLLVSKDPQNRPFRTIAYDDSGRMTSVTDGAGNTTQIDTSLGDRQQVITSPDGRMTSVTSFDTRGNLSALVESFDSTNRTTTYGYDENDNLVKTTDPMGHSTLAAYDSAGNQVALTDPMGRTTRFEYDSNNALAKTTAPDQTVTATLLRNERGDLVSARDALGSETVFTYDSNGALASTTDPLGRTNTFQNDSFGNPLSTTDPLGNVSRVTYDSSNRPLSIIDPLGAITRFAYDVEGNVVSITDPLSRVRRFEYDSFGRKSAEVDAVGGRKSFSYDGGGRLREVTNRIGQTTRFEHDNNGRLTARIESDGSRTSLSYDGAGRLIGALNDVSQLSYAYDDADRLVFVSSEAAAESGMPTTFAEYDYDPAGNVSTVTDTTGVSTFAYDSRDLLTRRSDPVAGVLEFERDNAGRTTAIARANGVTTTYTRDQSGAITDIFHLRGLQTISEQHISYDPAGRIQQLDDDFGTNTLVHDEVGRLTSVDRAGTQFDEHYAYDSDGNRIGDGEIYDAAGRLAQDDRNSYTYDAEGRQTTRRNRLTGETVEFGWGGDSRLRSVRTANGELTQYRYDPLGRRAETVSPQQTVRFGYTTGGNPALQLDGENNVTARFSSGFSADDVIAAERNGATSFFLRDAVGSITSLSDADGGITARNRYGAYGQRIAIGSDEAFSYAGRIWDPESQTYDFRARQYDPTTGRFLTEDPMPAANLYAYADGDPSMFRDPTGMFSITDLGIGEFLRDAATRAYIWGGATRLGQIFATAATIGGGIACGDACNGLPQGNLGSSMRTALAARRIDPEKTVVIGRTKDLEAPGAIRNGEQALQLPDLGDPKLNWQQNSGSLRLAMRLGRPIRDASSIRDTEGPFLNLERQMLTYSGWTHNESTGYWEPPA